MSPHFIASQWATLCHSAHTTSSRLTDGVTASAAELMAAESSRFCRIAPPQDKESLEAAYTRRMGLSARLTAIARADAEGRLHPDCAAEILAEVQEFCATDLPQSSDQFLSMQQQNIELTARIVAICERDFAARTPSTTESA